MAWPVSQPVAGLRSPKASLLTWPEQVNRNRISPKPFLARGLSMPVSNLLASAALIPIPDSSVSRLSTMLKCLNSLVALTFQPLN